MWLFRIFEFLSSFLCLLLLLLLVGYIIERKKVNTERMSDKAPTPISGLTREDSLYSVLGRFRENLVCRRYLSAEIFLVNHRDSLGNEYWRGWFDMPVLDVARFAEILAIHKANEYADSKAETNTVPVSPIKNMILKYNTERKRALLVLRNAAKGEVSFFRGDYSLLSDMKDDELSNGWKVEHWPLIRSLTEVELNPREALKWFVTTSTYTDLLPESLRAWWDRQSNGDTS